LSTPGAPAARREECGQAGRLIAVSRDGLEICCGGGTVYVIERLQRENKKAMEAAAFVRAQTSNREFFSNRDEGGSYSSRM